MRTAISEIQSNDSYLRKADDDLVKDILKISDIIKGVFLSYYNIFSPNTIMYYFLLL